MRTLARVLPAVTVAVLGSTLCCPAAVSAEAPMRSVLTIHTGTEDFPANPILDAAIRRALASPPALPIAYFAEYLEVERFGEQHAGLALAEFVRLKYRGRPIDVVIAITSTALRFVLAHRNTLFPDAAVVFAGLTVPEAAIRRTGRGLAAVRVGSAYANTLRLALQLHPSTERVFVVANSTNPQNVEAVRDDLRLFARQIPLTYVAEKTVSRLLTAVAAIPPRSVILHIWHQEPPPGHGINPEEIARLVARAAQVPVYGVIDSNIGSGIVGGIVRGTEETGVGVGDIVRKVLAGAKPQDIPVENAPLVATFDWRQLKRWHIDPSQLPRGSEIRFQVPTVWETYRGSLIGIAAIIAAQLVLIIWLLAERTTRRYAEQRIGQGEKTLRLSYERIRELTGRLINAQEAVRAQIARDLHDDVCQDLVGVSMAIRGLKGSPQLQNAGTQHALSDLHRWTAGIANGLRRLSHELHPAALQLLGLGAALKAHCIEVEKRYDVQVGFTASEEIGRVAPDVELCLFRIAQEALRNGAVHGDARRLRVTLARSGTDLAVSVIDDGCGFDLEAVRRDGRGLGLVSVEERARLVGGDVHIVTAPGQGTTILARVPAGESPAAYQRAPAEKTFATRLRTSETHT